MRRATPAINTEVRSRLTLKPTCAHSSGPDVVNDVHSRLNATRVRSIVDVRVITDARDAIVDAAPNEYICIAGARHGMGGQQFLEDGILLDTRRFDRVIGLDHDRGLVEVEAGIQWPALIRELGVRQCERAARWTIRQKQTGTDNLSIGGALAANVHGRGLTMRPFIDDVESFTIVDARGALRRCSRSENRELFRLAIGGYGLFGFIATVTLRLTRRQRLRRVVELVRSHRLAAAFAERIATGAHYGDFQFAIDPDSPDFLDHGILSTYHPVTGAHRECENTLELNAEQWRQLLFLAHTDKSRAFDLYAQHYLATSGQLYRSDAHQLAFYSAGYHGEVGPGSEMITEIYVPRASLAGYLQAAAEELRRSRADVVYGTVRLIERDSESFLAWATEPWACIVLNLHVDHTESGVARAADSFRRLIDLATARGGSYYLTYHRWATRAQLEACHPRFGEFLRLKQQYDPGELFQSEWYRHHRDLFRAELESVRDVA